ncbi:MAG: hypothetical protein OEV49_11645 [candidate division Zixibacteria bacterium]|nr:hypothetical protein [candidate division Zixibacteria bacterium]MDH3939258.1 hypothetical protein [candidate division Zixibacteria bacterium]MDH4032733.1 hypothetical protein [candidate division Zixibacteria bacterium]
MVERFVSIFAVVWLLSGASLLQAREVSRADKGSPNHSLDHHISSHFSMHDIGKIQLQIGSGAPITSAEAPLLDFITGKGLVRGCHYPQGYPVLYLDNCWLWVGSVVGRDTLVSIGREMLPEIPPFGEIRARSINGPDGGDPDAVSEQDRICTYVDAGEGPADYFRHGPHIPLGLEITQNSYAWSYEYAEDFVLFDLDIRNISDNVLNDVYLGLRFIVNVGTENSGYYDLCGFLTHVSSPFGCGFVDTVNIAWCADNDGDPSRGEWIDPPRWSIGSLEASCRHVTGATLLHTPGDADRPTFNWWAPNGFYPNRDFGPRRRANFRDFRTGGLGEPKGDVNKYHVLSNYELDYDQAFTANISDLDSTWLYPDQELAPDISDGAFIQYLLSQGAYTLYPGQSLSLVFAYVAGENFHNDVNNLNNLRSTSYDPVAYYANLDFSDLAKNTMWAQWIYDNPGIDTDGDGYYGESRICVYDSMLTDSGWLITAADTEWYRGDGVADWRGAAPPPAPYVWLTSLVGGVHVRFNGERSEVEKDIFLHIPDFEGYRVYFGRDSRATSLALIASYDNENYDKFVFDDSRRDEDGRPIRTWELYDIPYTLDSLRCLYGRGVEPCNDSAFLPLLYSPGDPYVHPDHTDSLFYFVEHDYNQYRPEDEHSIRKRFPNQRDPRSLSSEELTDEDYTEDGYLKFFEYEFTIDNLLPTVSYWVNVTAFDFGSPKSNLDALETSKTVGVQEAYPFNTEAEAAGTNDQIYIYPNPYRIDGDYRARGFEGRNEIDRPDYRVRAIHFTNLPPKCTIRIHSLDGDLVRELQHDMEASLPTARDHEWDLVTRNTQMIATGLYYWTVESPDGSIQMGKLVILM